MAAHIGQPARSRRFIKVYLCTWGLLAVGALAYLAMLAFPPQAASPPQAAVTPPASSGAGESKAIAEVRGSLSEVRKDVTELQSAVGERVENEKVVQTRLTALEERVSTVDPPLPFAPDGGKAAEAARLRPRTASRRRATLRTRPRLGPRLRLASSRRLCPSRPAASRPRRRQRRRSSLARRSSLGAARSSPCSWQQPPLSTRSNRAGGSSPSAMPTRSASLRPRVVAPRGEGGAYRLIAGPLATKADAERVCSELGVGPKACFPTPYSGAPL